MKAIPMEEAGCIFYPDDLLIRPMQIDGTPDMSEGVAVDVRDIDVADMGEFTQEQWQTIQTTIKQKEINDLRITEEESEFVLEGLVYLRLKAEHEFSEFSRLKDKETRDHVCNYQSKKLRRLQTHIGKIKDYSNHNKTEGDQ